MATGRKGKVEKARNGEITQLYAMLRSLDFALSAVRKHYRILNDERQGAILLDKTLVDFKWQERKQGNQLDWMRDHIGQDELSGSKEKIYF